MNAKYKGWTDQQRWQEYSRLKQEFVARHGYTLPSVYDAFIKRIVDELGI